LAVCSIKEEEREVKRRDKARHKRAIVDASGDNKSHSVPRADRPPPDVEGLPHDPDGYFSHSPKESCDQADELRFVDMDTFLTTF